MVVQHSEYTKNYQIVNGEICVMGTISQKKKIGYFPAMM